MNASSNASVGKLRKHPCGALGAGKQQRLAAGGSRGAHVARLGSAGARGSTAKTLKHNPRRHKRHRGAQIREVRSAWIQFAQRSFLFGEGSGPLRRGVKSSGPQNFRRGVQRNA